MNRKIDVDEHTATALEAVAAAQGISVAEVVAEFVGTATAPPLSPEEIRELDAQWAAIQAGEPTVPHEDVVRWLKTWGTPDFKPWPI